MVKVSVVIPVYNVEEFLNECLNSISNQTLKDIEIICVNDGSTDKSLDILNYYAENDNRFTVISQDNGGHAVATNRGMKLAKGEYLYLMDSDDILELTALEETYNYAKEKDVDFVLFQSLNYVMDEDRIYKSDIYSMEHIADFVGDSVFDYEDLGDMIFEIPVTPWSKLYNNQFIKDIGATFPEGLVFDDNIFFWDVLFNAKRIAFYRKHLFKRRWYSYSSTTAGDYRFLDSIDIHNLMVNRFEKYGLLDKYKEKVFNRKVNMAYNRFTDIKPEFEEDYFEKLHDDFKKCVDEGLYEEYMEDTLDRRNKAIFESCIVSKSSKEFKYEMAYWDAMETRKRLEKDISKLKGDIEKLINEKSKLFKNQNNLKNEVKLLEDENIALKNNNLKLKNKILDIESSNKWKIMKNLNVNRSSKGSYNAVLFNIAHYVVSSTDLIKLNNFKVFNSSNNPIRINFSKMIIIYDEVNKIRFNELKELDDGYYGIPASLLGRGKHKICVQYDDTFSEECSIFVKDSNNLFDFNIWLGTENTGDTFGFDKYQVESIESSEDWSDIGKKCIKVICDGENNYQALTTPKINVNVGDYVSAYVTVLNPDADVIVRLYESANSSFNNIKISASSNPTRVHVGKTATSNYMQLVIISRTKQIFYADNFVLTRN